VGECYRPDYYGLHSFHEHQWVVLTCLVAWVSQEEKARCRLEHEVTCLTVNPLAKNSSR
jgi:hypothetical protein